MFDTQYLAIASLLTPLIAMVSLVMAVRSELRKSTEQMLCSKLEDEKRHSAHERRMSVLEQRVSYIETALTIRLDEINLRIKEFGNNLSEHTRGDS